MTSMGTEKLPGTHSADEQFDDVVGFISIPDDTSVFIVVMHNDHRFCISVSESSLKGAPVQTMNEYLHLFSLLESDDSNAETGDPVEKMSDWVIAACLTQFATLAPPETKCQPQNLFDYFNPNTFSLELVIADGELTAVQIVEDMRNAPFLVPNITLSESIERLAENIPRVDPSEVKIDWTVPYYVVARPTKVFVGEEAYFFKPSPRGMDRHIGREIETLFRLRQSGLDVQINVPVLHGLVRYGDSAGISGLLLTYIEHRNTLADVLRSITPVSKDLKLKWHRQVIHMLSQLHAAGIVWGDAKTDNILVDYNDDLWLIDYGGGYTRGFVDESVAETLEGDLQGLSVLVDLLNS
ncbi:hypothetical protein L228DRAFT_244406 [Xylona heveae TC161]|uniref:Protein kinase domain-containing protein n=1 Tax=Xylona heveae (strain CBS 132557 / TC161) TaxID=1328760 RepID=A0A165IYE8_XYLHT|nr:hypothetical protein L228DRAFT_244406 [Xylona heveae TC161]KZF25549.1 hypothetical protein L228DRAFT_244406 [Xylona heveae TC161]